MGVEVMEIESPGIYPVANGSRKCWQISFKFIELILCMGCLLLIDEPARNSRIRVFVAERTVAICYATFGAYFLYCVGFLVAHLCNDYWPWKSTTVWELLGTLLFTLCNIMLHKDWSDAKERNFWPPNQERMNLLIGSAILSGINAVVHLIDAVLIIAIGRR